MAHFNFLRPDRGTVIGFRLLRTLINSDAMRYPWRRIQQAGDARTRSSCTARLCVTTHRVAASRLNIADIMLLYFITRVHRMRYAGSFPRILHISPASRLRASAPPSRSTRPRSLYILLYAARFRLPAPPFRNITLRAHPPDSADSRNML